MNRTVPDRRTAFTLMELLVVMGVIAILVSLLFVALKTGGVSGRIQTTKALVHQVGMAITQYMDAYGDMPLLDTASKPSSYSLWYYLVAWNIALNRAPYLNVQSTFKLDDGQNSSPGGGPSLPACLIIDGFGQPMIYDRYNGNNLPFRVHNYRTYDFFSAGAYASQIVVPGKGTLADLLRQGSESYALSPTTDGTAYKYEEYRVGGNAINKYIGNW